jgi:hypothetical protein
MMEIRRRRTAKIAAYLLTGAFLLQLGGPACAMLGSTAIAGFDFGALMDNNGKLFGLFNVCGVPNYEYVDANNVPVSSVLNTGDDLIFDCPITFVKTTTTGTSTGTGTGG